MDFHILGPLEVTDGDGRIPLDAPKQRVLLGVLLLHPNEVVSSERLIDELWGERPPATATKVVQTYVSQLRRALGPDAIATRPPGYELHVEADALDAVRFRTLVAEARRLADNGEQEGADALYREALALWRGPALSDVVFESFGRNEVERLEEERLGALMDRIDCEFALGRHDELVAELETLVKQHPLRERLRAQLILALYRSGRQADALAAYQDARRTLVEELGLEPSRDLHDLEKAILTHDPALQAPRRPANEQLVRRLPIGWRALAAASLVLLVVALGLAFTLRREEPAPTLLPPNSVGFIDAGLGRVTRSFPVGRMPTALAVARDSVWVANQEDETVSRLDRRTGKAVATIPVGAHPTGITVHENRVWVWTVEGMLVPIDPRFNVAGQAVELPAPGGDPVFRGVDAPAQRRQTGKIISAGGFLWLTAPGTTVIQVLPATPERHRSFVPSDGAQGALVEVNGNPWVGGFTHVFPIAARTGNEGTGIRVGEVRDLAFGGGSLWVVSGLETGAQGVSTALRRVDVRSRVVQTTVALGSNPVAVAVADGSLWLAGGRGIQRVDLENDQPIEAISLGSSPTDLAGDVDGVWVAVK